MNPTTNLILTALLGASMSVAALEAQSVAALYPSGSAASSTALNAENTDRSAITARLERAEVLLQEGRYRDAAREYSAIAKQQQAANIYAGETLWKLAQVQHGRRGAYHAAPLFDAVATEAAHYGDTPLQARALLEASILYVQSRKPELALQRLQRLEPLLSSPAMPEDVRNSIQQRIKRD